MRLDRNLGWPCRSVCRLAFQDAVQEPHNETIDEQHSVRADARFVIQVPHFEWNQRSRRKHHQEFGPPLLKINSDSLGEQNRRVEERQQSGRMERATSKYFL